MSGLGTRRWGEDGWCELAMTIAKCLQRPSSPPPPSTQPAHQPAQPAHRLPDLPASRRPGPAIHPRVRAPGCLGGRHVQNTLHHAEARAGVASTRLARALSHQSARPCPPTQPTSPNHAAPRCPALAPARPLDRPAKKEHVAGQVAIKHLAKERKRREVRRGGRVGGLSSIVIRSPWCMWCAGAVVPGDRRWPVAAVRPQQLVVSQGEKRHDDATSFRIEHRYWVTHNNCNDVSISSNSTDGCKEGCIIKIHLRDLTLIVISRPGYHTVLVQGPARTNRSPEILKKGDSCTAYCVYSRKLSGAPSYSNTPRTCLAVS